MLSTVIGLSPLQRAKHKARGYAKLYAQEILGADEGCDFAFLRPERIEGRGK